ncbi:helix-turn-helix domain-containing protein [Alistipes senegalensis]|uniref:Helix-turn-helix transcriptional regulator n=1 Tax=Alistipes senegalensis JC50 TaxID=1033732 RepID=A0ABY5VBA9_9BACT|nr:helix-turn-helix transcriptional regulator [Alistipes senegalensis]UEA86257.1 helix-turn-helix transcriptional regulator [Alistipes senegalensis]UWN66156.1 helix-turn-helix transcriptional regulator [Alistipes senegalensis JC50]
MIDLQRFRKEHKIKQCDIATLFGVSQPYVSAIERGVRPLNEEQFRLLYNRYGDILLPYKITERPIFETQELAKIEMPREVFDKISRLIDTVCAQQETIAGQQGTIAGQQDLLSKMQILVDKALTPPHHKADTMDGADSEGGRDTSKVG